MDVHVRQLRYFLAVADDLHFTRAAERLFVSQPALSKQVWTLEQQLGVRLFARDRQGTALTDAGRALLPHARDLVDRWEHAERAVTAVVGGAELTVGFATSIGRGLVPALRQRFAVLRPGRRLAFTQVPWSDPTAGLADGTADVALMWLPVPDPDAFPAEVLVTEPRWVALPVGHRLAGRGVVPFLELLDAPFLALPESAGPLRSHWLAEDARGGRPAVVAAVVATAEETFEAVAAGIGVALLSRGNAALYARPDVTCRPVTGVAPSELAVVRRRDDDRPQVHDLVRACVEATGAAEPAATGQLLM
ncbi:MAG: LysR family transcriptional regulator [Kineosporiaceae bacterium]